MFSEDVQRIIETAMSPSQQLSGMTQWSLEKLWEYPIEQGIVGDISLEWLRQIPKRAGQRLRRTKTWREWKDPRFLKKSRRIGVLYD